MPTAAEHYVYETEITVRFRDIDSMGQVHNAVFLTYAEEGRVRYFRDVLDVSLPETNGAIVHQEIDYHAPVTLDADLTVRYRVARVGETSLTMEFEVVVDGETAATGEVVQVLLDEDDAPRSIPTAWRDKIDDFEKSVDVVETESSRR
jgi:acyl-CoA thioester hydrolase